MKNRSRAEQEMHDSSMMMYRMRRIKAVAGSEAARRYYDRASKRLDRKYRNYREE